MILFLTLAIIYYSAGVWKLEVQSLPGYFPYLSYIALDHVMNSDSPSSALFIHFTLTASAALIALITGSSTE